MSTLAPPIADWSRANRSAITNSSWKLEGVDNRKAAGRRYRDLCMAFADDVGGANRLTAWQSTTIRQLAGVTVEAEKIQAAIVLGEGQVDHEQLVRLANLQARLMSRLGIKPGAPVAEEEDLASYLAGAAE